MQQGELKRKQIAVALDYPEIGPALALAERLGGDGLVYKIGLELFIAAGAEPVRRLKQSGARIFLDLKLHDIPNTVAGAVRAAAQLDVDFLTVHLSGGPAMLEAAAEAAPKSLTLLGVSVLTSMDAAALSAVGVQTKLEDQVLALAGLGVQAGIRGVVCSPLEAPLLRQVFGPNLFLVTPGVRPASAGLGDQKRVMTPRAAIQAGADLLVIGRPITVASDPLEALREILEAA
jgi:orotidine-5'-phosphate decarboxylase